MSDGFIAILLILLYSSILMLIISITYKKAVKIRHKRKVRKMLKLIKGEKFDK